MLKTRIITAAVLIPAVLAALFLLPTKVWGFVVLAIILVAAYEWARLTALPRWLDNLFMFAVFIIPAQLLLAEAAGFDRGWSSGIVYMVCGVASLFWIFIAPPWVIARWPTQAKIPMAILGVIVLVGTWMAVVQLQGRSPWLVLAAMAIVWIADTAAYFTGRAFGKHKLAPVVSPGKSWEGVFGAWLAVAIYGAALVPLAARAGYHGVVAPATIAAWIAFVVVLASISVVGDLFESLLKRHAGVKDSGSLLPGHGGILDRIDALLAAMPIAAVAAQLMLDRNA
jgi:phosphatidate cytidylyltransferase